VLTFLTSQQLSLIAFRFSNGAISTMEFTLLTLFVAATINAAIPGPCILYVLGRSAAAGLASGLRVTLGIALGVALLIATAWSVILGALSLSAHGLEAMRVAGIALLLALAILLMRARPAVERPCAAGRVSVLGDFGAGFALAAASPFYLLFTLALPPSGRRRGADRR
jgi:threonine/homoserine/homoserine lactone efflux protein